MPLDHRYKDLTFRIVGCAMEVHRGLGPGLLESIYRTCLQHELALQGLRTSAEVPIPVSYKGVSLDASYRADLIVEGIVLLELKAVEQLLPVHLMQTLTYLRLAKLPIGFVMNFNTAILKHGIRRFVNHNSSPERAAVALPPRS